MSKGFDRVATGASALSATTALEIYNCFQLNYSIFATNLMICNLVFAETGLAERVQHRARHPAAG
jgi:hypothetical protein